MKQISDLAGKALIFGRSQIESLNLTTMEIQLQ